MTDPARVPPAGVEAQAGRLLGLRRADPLFLVRTIRGGLPYHAVERLCARAGLSLATLGELIGVTPRTLARRRREGRLQPDESDRLVRASRIIAAALELFEGDWPGARAWLEAPQRGLGGAAPLAFAVTDIGAREVERLIGRLEHGVFA